jgi:glycogen debranching enzyme
MGDELGRTQHGNNNAYAQDNATSWLDWSTADESLIDFTAALMRARREHSALHSDRWLTGAATARGATDGPADVEWRRPDGSPMTPHDWTSGAVRTLIAAFAEGDDRVVVALHAAAEPVDIVLPALDGGRIWTRVLRKVASHTLAPRSVELFVATPTSDTLQP